MGSFVILLACGVIHDLNPSAIHQFIEFVFVNLFASGHAVDLNTKIGARQILDLVSVPLDRADHISAVMFDF